MEELRPCPFCGKVDSVVVSTDTPRLFVVACTGQKGGCGARSLFSEKRETAIFWWNHRATPEIIYCKDCRWLMRPDPDNPPAEFEPYCDHPCGLPGELESLEQFCSYGERLDGESDCCH